MINNGIASPIYNKLSSTYDQLYLQNIQSFQNKVADTWLGDGWFVDFYPSLGIKTSQVCDLLFYGQALNGWASGFDVFGEYAQEKVNESIITSNRYFAKQNHSPLDWVNVRWNNHTFNAMAKDEEAKLFYSNGDNYRAYRSFFWQVVSKLTNDLYGFDKMSSRWSKKIVWSNLYKIAEDGANPNRFLREQQLETAAELVKQEIAELKPKYCILLTNYVWWQPFQHLLGTSSLPYDKSQSCIVSYEQLGETKLIITTRPRFGTAEIHISEILKLIG